MRASLRYVRKAVTSAAAFGRLRPLAAGMAGDARTRQSGGHACSCKRKAGQPHLSRSACEIGVRRLSKAQYLCWRRAFVVRDMCHCSLGGWEPADQLAAWVARSEWCAIVHLRGCQRCPVVSAGGMQTHVAGAISGRRRLHSCFVPTHRPLHAAVRLEGMRLGCCA